MCWNCIGIRYISRHFEAFGGIRKHYLTLIGESWMWSEDKPGIVFFNYFFIASLLRPNQHPPPRSSPPPPIPPLLSSLALLSGATSFLHANPWRQHLLKVFRTVIHLLKYLESYAERFQNQMSKVRGFIRIDTRGQKMAEVARVVCCRDKEFSFLWRWFFLEVVILPRGGDSAIGWWFYLEGWICLEVVNLPWEGDSSLG